MESFHFKTILLWNLIFVSVSAINLHYIVDSDRNMGSTEMGRCPWRRPNPDTTILPAELALDGRCWMEQPGSYNQCRKEDLFCHQDFLLPQTVGLGEFTLSMIGELVCDFNEKFHLLSWNNLHIDFVCRPDTRNKLQINGISESLTGKTFHIILLRDEAIDLNLNGKQHNNILKMNDFNGGRRITVGHHFKTNDRKGYNGTATFSGKVIRADLFLRRLTNIEQDNELQYSRLVLKGRPHPWCLCPNGKLPSVEEEVLCEDGTNRLTGAMSADISYTPPESLHDGINNSSLGYGFWIAHPGDLLRIKLRQPSKVYQVEIIASKMELVLLRDIDCYNYSTILHNNSSHENRQWTRVDGESFYMMRWKPECPVLLNKLVVRIGATYTTDNRIYEINVQGRPIGYPSSECSGLTRQDNQQKQCGRSRCNDTGAGANCLPYITKIFPSYGPARGGNIITMMGGMLATNKTSVCETDITIADLQLCSIIDRLPSKILCTTKGLPDKAHHMLGQRQSVSVSIMVEDIAYTIPADLWYQYRPDPIITDVQPRFAFARGGRNIKIYGHHLDSIPCGTNQSFLVVQIHGGPQKSLICHNATTTEAIYRMPELEEHVTSASIRLLVPDSKNFTIQICPTPHIEKAIVPISPGDPLQIQGSQLDSSCGLQYDYKVTFGGVIWPVQSRGDTTIICDQPAWRNYTAEASKHPILIKVFNYEFTPSVIVNGPDKGSQSMGPVTLVFIGLFVTSVVVFIGVMSFKIWPKYFNKQPREVVVAPTLEEITLSERGEPTVLDLLDGDLRQVVAEKLIDKSRLDMREVIGRGNFGKVYRGILDTDTDSTVVALKTFSDNASGDEICEFLEEATIMRDFQHPNILSLLGVMVDGLKCYVIMPFMSNGDLRSFVSKQEFNLKKFTGLALDVARGMAYLSKQKFIHRDLAARNCLVNASENAVVGDFGLARDIYHKDYYKASDDKGLPYKWMALETLAELAFSIKSDVWAFGVLIWEIFTKGGKPYPLIANPRMKSHLKRGHRLDKPDNCPIELFSLLEDCWLANPAKRPSFSTLVTELERLLVNITTVGCSQQSSSNSSSSSVTSVSSCSSSSTGTAAQAHSSSIYLLPTKPMPPVPLPRLSKVAKV